MKIIAKGQTAGITTIVECRIKDNKITFLFDGEKNSFEEKNVRSLMRQQKPFGGTYYPPVNSALNVYNVLENYYFDRLLSIECDGELEEMPSVEGRVY